MIVKAPAKINVYLDVINKRDDGYHDLESVMLPLELHDSLEIIQIPANNDDLITCDDFSLSVSEYNLAARALKAMRDKYNFKAKFRIKIHKSIPMSAGLGGGSSDAAAVILGVSNMLKLHRPIEELVDLAKKLGADIPFFLFEQPAYVEGIGEEVTPIKVAKRYDVLIVKPEAGLSTKEVFGAYDSEEPVHSKPDNILLALTKGDDELLSAKLFNALEQPAFRLLPIVKEIKNELKVMGLDKVMMSGSGSVVYALSDNHHLLTHVAAKMEKKGHLVILTATKGPKK